MLHCISFANEELSGYQFAAEISTFQTDQVLVHSSWRSVMKSAALHCQEQWLSVHILVFSGCLQAEVCSGTVAEIIQSVVNGADGCIFSFGHVKLGKLSLSNILHYYYM